MSTTKRLIEKYEEESSFKSALQAILDSDKISHQASMGVLKKALADGNLESLSEKQIEVFQKYISPLLHLKCDMCKCDIPLAHYPEAMANEVLEGMVLCDGCLVFRQQMRKD